MNSGQPRELTLPLGFLKPDVAYVAHRYIDDPSMQTDTNVRIERQEVDSGTTLQITLSAQGGQAIRITPK